MSKDYKNESDWQKTLTPEQFHVLRKHGTEPPGSSPLVMNKADGTYQCAGCGQTLFESGTKYDSCTGWPSFYDAIPGSVETSTDYVIGYARTEVHCAKCGGHLGHVFEDGPQPTGQRYCMNGVALKFVPTP